MSSCKSFKKNANSFSEGWRYHIISTLIWKLSHVDTVASCRSSFPLQRRCTQVSWYSAGSVGTVETDSVIRDHMSHCRCSMTTRHKLQPFFFEQTVLFFRVVFGDLLYKDTNYWKCICDFCYNSHVYEKFRMQKIKHRHISLGYIYITFLPRLYSFIKLYWVKYVLKRCPHYFNC